jgi:hypothetical protein
MEMWQKFDSYTDKPRLVLGKLGPLLSAGSLTMFMGAGLSMSSGKYQNWPNLVRSCTSELNINLKKAIDDDEPIDNLLKYMSQVRQKLGNKENKYRELVNKNLNASAVLDYKDAANLLLMSVGALCMGSKRGSIKEVVTYNFDDLLEWYFALNGFVAQVVTDLPYLASDSDITVYHPHGFLPKLTTDKKSERFVFDQLSYDRTIGNEVDPWFTLCKQILLRKVAIFIGLSGEDPAMRTLVTRVNDVLKAEKQDRPVGFLLNLDSKIENKEALLERGVIPLGFKDYDAIYKFLFSICKKASGRIM